MIVSMVVSHTKFVRGLESFFLHEGVGSLTHCVRLMRRTPHVRLVRVADLQVGYMATRENVPRPVILPRQNTSDNLPKVDSPDLPQESCIRNTPKVKGQGFGAEEMRGAG